jgi:CRP-like cAMP-binding protein/Pyruvate/2-oxoacid:ferredoxin oxidoreductase delta subunit
MPIAPPISTKTKTLTVTIDDKTFPIVLDYRVNARNQWRFYGSVTASGGRPVEIELGEDQEITIWDAARLWNLASPSNRIEIPGLCHMPELGYQAVGVCRLCSVSIIDKGRPGTAYAAACMRQCQDGMSVLAADQGADADPKLTKARDRLREARKTLVELLLAEHPAPCKREQEKPGACELEAYGRRYGLLKETYKDNATAWVSPTVFKPREPDFIPPPDKSNFSIAIDHSACILCDRCVRACSHPEVDQRVIGRMGKGRLTQIGFDNNLPMKDSSCVNCGWCMVSCPTGAITFSGENKSTDSPWPDGGVPLDAESMRELDLVKDNKINVNFLERSGNGAVVKHFNKGEVLCKQGDYGRTAFYINSGKVEIFVNLPDADAGADKKRGLLSRLMGIGQSLNPLAGNAIRTKPIPVSPGVELDPVRPIATIGAGRLLGEQACLNNQPRSATVVVAEDGTEVVIMFRNFLDILTRNRAFRAKLEEETRRWAVERHLETSPYLKGLPEEVRAKVKNSAAIVRFTPGETIFNEGDESDAFYMIRLGHVRVKQGSTVESEVTLRYMTPGDVFGEIGAMFDVRRTATCVAMDNVQLVRIARDDLAEMLAASPEVKSRLEERALGLLQRDGSTVVRDAVQKITAVLPPRRTAGELPARRTAALNQYLNQELFQGQDMLVLDLEKCTRCDECVTACAQSHLGISRLIRDGLRYDKYLVTTSCRSCRDPKCLVGCPVDAIHRKGSLPIVIEDHCVGCGRCAESCPFGNITMLPVETVDPDGTVQQGRQAAVCNLDNCIEEKREPSCVYACPHDAAHRVDGPEFFGTDVLGGKESELPI